MKKIERGGNAAGRTIPYTLITDSSDRKGGLLDVPHLTAIEILVRGRCAKSDNIYSTQQSAEKILLRVAKKVPEVMVKVTGGGMSTGQISSHVKYITRNGKLDAETDEGERLIDNDEIAGYIAAWEIDTRLGAGERRQAHNIMLSMPQGTDPEQVRLAAKSFAQEQFGTAKYPYVMVLHTDRAHPHVHLCVRVTSEDSQQKKLYIRKANLETYRQHFADKLIERGIEAAATPRELRGVVKKSKKISIYHAEHNKRSTIENIKVLEIINELKTGKKRPEPWKERIKKRREVLIAHYNDAIVELENYGKYDSAAQIREYMKKIPPLITERDELRMKLIDYVKQKQDKISINKIKKSKSIKIDRDR